MVLSSPRSGSTWASNWLTTDKTLCLHDPLWTHHYLDLDKITSHRAIGVACTGLYLFPEWVNNHPARKVILHRNLEEINESLIEIGLGEITAKQHANLDLIEGWHIEWTDIFDKPKKIYEYLLELPFDDERHGLLREIEMQPNFEKISIGKAVTRRLINELRSI